VPPPSIDIGVQPQRGHVSSNSILTPGVVIAAYVDQEINQIDGAIALIMALARAMTESGGSRT
jgi:hypothetical protein